MERGHFGRGPEGWSPEGWWGPKFRAFFPSSTIFSFVLRSLGGLLVEFGVCSAGALKCSRLGSRVVV